MRHVDVVFIHTLGGSAETWADVIDHTQRLGISTTTLELPGHGSNARCPDGVSAAAASAIGQLHLEDGAGDVNLVGSGAGSRLAIEIARLWPHRVRSLTIASYAPIPNEEARIRLAHTAATIAHSGMRAFASTYVSNAAADSRSSAVIRFRDQLAATSADAITGTLRWALTCDGAALGHIATRTLCIRGSADAIATPTRFCELAERLRASYVEIAEAGHIAYIEQPQAFAEAVVNFVLDGG